MQGLAATGRVIGGVFTITDAQALIGARGFIYFAGHTRVHAVQYSAVGWAVEFAEPRPGAVLLVPRHGKRLGKKSECQLSQR